MKNNSMKVTIFISLIISGAANAEFFSNSGEANRNIDLLEKQRMKDQVEEEKKQEKNILENSKENDFIIKDRAEGEGVKFDIKKISIENDNIFDLSPQRNAIIDSYKIIKIGRTEIVNIISELTNFYISKGYITTQVTIVPSSLKQGELKLRVLWGTLRGFKENGEEPGWRENIRMLNAMPFAKGKPLKMSDIDQALDNLMRVSPSDRLQIVATDKTGTSDVNHISNGFFPLSIHVGMNNSGYRDSGWDQYYVSTSLKNILGINDVLNYYYSYNNFNAKTDKQNSRSISYSFPFGYWAIDFLYYKSLYSKVIGGMFNNGYKSDGDSERYTLKLSRVLYRNDKGKVSGYIKTASRKNNNNIMNTPIAVSSKNYSSVTAGITWVGPILNGWAYTDLNVTAGRPWFNSAWKKDPDLKGFDVNYKKVNGVVNWNTSLLEIMPSRLSIDYELNGAFQYTNDVLVSDERYTLGDEYTVRGYKENSLSAERVAWISNTFKMPIKINYATLYQISPFVGMDFGMARKNCLSGVSCPKDYMSGATAGIKLNSSYFNGSFGAGWPLKKPASLENTKLDNYTLYFNFDFGF